MFLYYFTFLFSSYLFNMEFLDSFHYNFLYQLLILLAIPVGLNLKASLLFANSSIIAFIVINVAIVSLCLDYSVIIILLLFILSDSFFFELIELIGLLLSFLLGFSTMHIVILFSSFLLFQSILFLLLLKLSFHSGNFIGNIINILLFGLFGVFIYFLDSI